MDEIFAGLAAQLQELALYKAKYGELDIVSRFTDDVQSSNDSIQ